MTDPTADPELSGKFRDQIQGPGVPSWLQGPNGARLMYSMAVQYDALADAMTLAIFYGLAKYAPPDAIPWIGLDRQIAQGFQEGAPSYVSRLIQWLDRWPYAGKAAGVLMAVRGWILPQMPLIEIIKDSPGGGTVTTWSSYIDGQDPMPPGASTVTPPFIAVESPRNFNWDGNYPAPTVDADGEVHFLHRNFLVVFSTSTSWIASSGTWGSSGKKWGDKSKSWGFAAPSSVMTGLRGQVKQWKSAGTWYQWIIVNFDPTLFDPTQPADGTHNPAGTFGRWGHVVSGQYVRARFTGARYANGPDWPGGT